jgi:hypothetical protein
VPEEEDVETRTTSNNPKTNTLSSLTLADALTEFGEHLRTDGRGQSSVARTVSHVRGFVT